MLREREIEPSQIRIPGEPEAVDLSRVRGDTDNPISLELTPDADWWESLRQGKDVGEVLARGGRVFLTEGDELLFVEPKKVLGSASF